MRVVHIQTQDIFTLVPNEYFHQHMCQMSNVKDVIWQNDEYLS